MEIKGLISKGRTVSLTCCDKIQDLEIGDDSLYNKLEEFFDLENTQELEGRELDGELLSMKYVIMDDIPDENKSFNDLSAEIITKMIACDHINGCYSEWTCGLGGFDYVNNDSAHSIFQELITHEGLYAHIVLTSTKTN